jgi:hypothetical protein
MQAVAAGVLRQDYAFFSNVLRQEKCLPSGQNAVNQFEATVAHTIIQLDNDSFFSLLGDLI